MVQVFKTNVDNRLHAAMLCDLIQTEFPVNRINFDLDDCDKIFRVESNINIDSKIISFLHERGFACEELPD